MIGELMYHMVRFQSTLPSQGATFTRVCWTSFHYISIHAPLTGSDCMTVIWVLRKFWFQSTLPSQGATDDWAYGFITNVISIHAPLTGSDGRSGCLLLRSGRFQSTLPSQGATEDDVLEKYAVIFQSTLPSQGATANIHIKFLCDLLFSTLSSKNSFTLSRFPQTITWFCAICTDKLCANVPLYLCTLYIRTTLKTLR